MSWLWGKNSTSASQIPSPTPLQQQRLKQIKSLSNYNQKYGSFFVMETSLQFFVMIVMSLKFPPEVFCKAFLLLKLATLLTRIDRYSWVNIHK